MKELTNQALNASDLLGKQIENLHDQLQNTVNACEMVTVAENFLFKKSLSGQSFHPVQIAAETILKQKGQVNFDLLVKNSNLSLRQLERKFDEQVGMPPKIYARIARFNHALRLKEHDPNLSWTDLTYSLGYFDQMHLIKDFRQLSGESPTKLFHLFAKIPEVFLSPNPAILK